MESEEDKDNDKDKYKYKYNDKDKYKYNDNEREWYILSLFSPPGGYIYMYFSSLWRERKKSLPLGSEA